MVSYLGKILIFSGIVLVLIGFVFLSGSKVSSVGRLPGDIYFEKDDVSIYFPFTTCLLLSLIFSLVFYILFKLFKG